MRYSRSKKDEGQDNTVSGFLFGLFIYFTIDFFIHFSERIPGYGVIRPTLLLSIIMAMMLYAQREKFSGYTSDPAFKTVIWLIIYILISVPFVTWPGSVLRENIPEFIKAVSFFFFAALILDTEKRMITFLSVFVACQVFRVLEPLYLHLVHGFWGRATHIGGGEFVGRLSGAPGDVINPNGLGFVIATVLPFLYYLLWRSNSKAGKLLFSILAPLMIYTLVLTLSRGAFLALIVVVWMIFKESRNKFGLLVVVSLAAVVMWANMSGVQKDRYLSLIIPGTSQSATVQGRIDGMWEEFELGLRRPLFGHGVGTTPEAKANFIGREKAAHNLYAEVMIETGLIGLFIFLKYLLSIYRSFRRNIKYMTSADEAHRSGFPYRLNQTLITVFWMYIVYSMVYWGLSVYHWYLFAGLTVAFSRLYFSQDMEEEAVAQKPRGRALA